MRHGKINDNKKYMVTNKNTKSEIQDLKAKREALGLSLKDVFCQTRVSVNYLQAIENEDFNLLPEPVYAKNFIKTYARALGVDEKIIIGRYDAYLDSLKILDNVTPKEEIARRGLFAGLIANYGKFLGVIFVFSVVLIILWLVSMQYWSAQNIRAERAGLERKINIASEDASSTQNGATVPLPTEEEITGGKSDTVGKTAQQTIPEANIGAKSNNKDAPVPGKKEAIQPVDERENGLLVIKAIEETWIRIRIDQNPIFQIVLKPGQKAEYKASVADMDIGNAGGVVIQFQGKTMENLGEPGEVIRLRLP